MPNTALIIIAVGIALERVGRHVGTIIWAIRSDPTSPNYKLPSSRSLLDWLLGRRDD
jgi:hypothetical protein